ncbi:MAG: polya polymerase, partial [Dehalococcoidia bacterium]|nr:polya polymerase [Dehalococcoidia bacterium]
MAATALLDRLYARLPEASLGALREVLALARRRRLDVYLAGGAVRDLLLGQEQVDLDVIVEGDAIALAKEAAARLDARAVAHTRFGTAVLRGREFRLDLARARSER